MFDAAFEKERILAIVVDPMRKMIHEYHADFDDGDAEDDDFYNDDDVENVKSVLDSYVDALAELEQPADGQIMEQVKAVVLALNEMNEARDYALIETDEREWLCEAIQTIAVDRGLQNVSGDITEEWREW